MSSAPEPTTPHKFHAGWYLAFPWIVAVLTLIAFTTGATTWLQRIAGQMTGQLIGQNALGGLMLLTPICSGLWARRRWYAKQPGRLNLGAYVAVTTLWLSLVQLLGMLAVFFVGCCILLAGSGLRH